MFFVFDITTTVFSSKNRQMGRLRSVVSIFMATGLLTVMMSGACSKKEQISKQEKAPVSSPGSQSDSETSGTTWSRTVPVPKSPPPESMKHDGIVPCAWVLVPGRHDGYRLTVIRDLLGNDRGAVVGDVLVPWGGVIPCYTGRFQPGQRVRARLDGGGTFLGLVVSDSGEGSIRIRRLWRFHEKTVMVPRSWLWPLTGRPAPLEVVFFRHAGQWFRGTAIYVTHDFITVLRRNDGRLLNVRNSDENIMTPAQQVAPGMRVLAFRSWGTNLRPGVVQRVIVPELFYEIRFGRVYRKVPYWEIALPQ